MKKTIKKLLVSSMVLSTFAVTAFPAVTVLANEEVSSIIAAVDVTNMASETELNKAITLLENSINKIEKDNKQLKETMEKNEKELKDIAEDIIKRNETAGKQAKIMQKETNSTNLVSSILNSGSLSEAIRKTTAMSLIDSSNKNTIKSLKTRRDELEKKQKENQETINKFEDNLKTLSTKKAEIDYAKLKLEQIRTQSVSAKALAEARNLVNQNRAVQNGTNSAIQSNMTAIQEAAAGQVIKSESIPTEYYTNNTYPWGQCTWGCKSMAPWVGDYWGNANMWGDSARAAGFRTGTVPVAGAIAVWPYDGGGYGHVAYVSAVESETNIQVLESNYAGNMYIGNFRGWFNPYEPSSGGTVYYIYPN